MIVSSKLGTNLRKMLLIVTMVTMLVLFDSKVTVKCAELKEQVLTGMIEMLTEKILNILLTEYFIIFSRKFLINRLIIYTSNYLHNLSLKLNVKVLTMQQIKPKTEG